MTIKNFLLLAGAIIGSHNSYTMQPPADDAAKESEFTQSLVAQLDEDAQALLRSFYGNAKPNLLTISRHITNADIQEKIKNYFALKNNMFLLEKGYILCRKAENNFFYLRLRHECKEIGTAEVRDRTSYPGCEMAYLYQLLIDKNYRGQGFGSQFLQAIINKLKTLQFKRVTLRAIPLDSAGNEITDSEIIKQRLPRLFAFYERHGFKKNGYYYGFEMQLDLAPFEYDKS